jgi:hypothetical protein
MSNRALSVMRLRKLEFDPIDSLVKTYRELEKEVQIQEQMRNGDLVRLNANGRVINYRPDVHHALYDKLITIGEKLLRFGYARVPETTIIEDGDRKPLTINLTGTDGVFKINDSERLPALAEPQDEPENE